MPFKETILVTGATGFIGGWLSEVLFFNNSYNILAGIRSWSSAARLGRIPVKIVLCDVLDTKQINAAVAEATAVVHCSTGSKEVIVQGTENMLTASSEMGIKRFVYLSTTEVYGNQSGDIDESHDYEYSGKEYGDSKIEAEKLCWDFQKKGLPVTVIRPSIVYGPFSKDWTVRVSNNLKSGNWGVFDGNGDGKCNLIYIDDLISGILLILEQEAAIGEAFNFNGNEIITWNQYFQRFNTALGFPKLNLISSTKYRTHASIMGVVRPVVKNILDYFEVPIRKIYDRSRLARNVMLWAEKAIKTTPTVLELNLYSRDAIYHKTKAQDILGFNPRFDVNSGLQMSVAWLDHLGLS